MERKIRLKQMRRKWKEYYSKNRETILQKQRDNPKRKIQRKVWDSNFRKRHIAYYRNREKIKRKKLKLLIFTKYSNGDIKCSCCGERCMEFLTIDHINGGGNKHRKELKKIGAKFYKWLKQNNFPNGYQVLCMNCNFAKGHFKECPHKRSIKND